MLQIHVDNAALVRLIWTLPGGGVMINVLGAQVAPATVINQGVANALGTAIKTGGAYGTYRAHISTGVALASVGVRDIRSVSLPEYLDPSAATAGTGAGDALPRSASLVISLLTAKAGRGYRGRVYLGGFTEAENDPDGTASSTLVTDAAAFMTAIQSAMNAQALTLAVVGRNRLARSTTVATTNPDGSVSTKVRSYPASAGHVDPVTALKVRNDVWDSQRRRTAPGSISTLFAPLYLHDFESGQSFSRADTGTRKRA